MWGVTMKRITKVVINETEARDWAIETHLFDLLTVNRKALETLAKLNDSTVPTEIARLTIEPTPYISGDLSQYLF